MAPLLIEGETLGEIHHKYNTLVNDAIKNKNIEITDINYDDSDFDNLFKIDIASTNRNVEYILKVLHSTDMLYVSRAIKKSPWLITDKQYANVINPEYLFNELRLHMTTKAFNKLILQIRLLLRDEERVEDFYIYYKEKDFQTALKWLPHCSQPFIDFILERHGKEVTNNLLKRLCEKSSTVLVTYCRYNKNSYKKEALYETMFVMNDDVERYLDLTEAMPEYTPTFTAKYTKIIMTKCRNRIMEKLDRYADYIDVPTFAKFLSEEDIKYLILRNIKNRTLRSWLRDHKVKYLINRLPADVRFEFMKKIFVDKGYKSDDSADNSMLNDAVPHRRVQRNRETRDNKTVTSHNLYTLYNFAPFETVFTDLKKKIRCESNPIYRVTILKVMLTTAGHDMQNIHTLLKYYRENHINEPFKFKNQFINMVLSKTKTYRYDKSTWKYLKDVFSSMEVFSKSDKNVQSCVRSVLLYCVINDEQVPEIIQTKIEFDTLKQYKKDFLKEERNKIFNYLLKFVFSKIQNDNVETEKDFKVMFGILENALILLCDWDKDLKDYPSILNKIKHLMEIKKENPAWDMDTGRLYNKKKSWKKLLFAESLIVSPAQETVMNALKHDSKLVAIYKNEIVELLKNNSNLDIFFKKIRIYWSQSLAKSFKEMLLEQLYESYNHKQFISGLCTLLPQKEFTEMIKKHVPSEAKIDCSKQDEVQVYIQKYLAMNLYLARPQPSLDMALLYAKGDYLQYAQPSLNAIFYNMSSTVVGENIETLFNCPVSVQKFGVRNAISKLKDEEIRRIFSNIWKSVKNSSVRALIFLHINKMLCKEDNEQLIKETWEIIKKFIDTLTPDEDNQIYTILSQSANIPMIVRGEYSIKSYEFFETLPAHANCNIPYFLHCLILQMSSTMLYIDDDFVVNLFMNAVEPKYSSESHIILQYISSFLLWAKNEEAQIKRYNKMFVPIFTKAFSGLNKNKTHLVPPNIYQIIMSLYTDFDIAVRFDLVFPVKMLTEILESLQKSILEIDNYIFLTFQKLGLKYITIVDKALRQEKERDPKSINELMAKYKIIETIGPEFGKACAEQLKEDIAKKDSSIYVDFAEAFNTIFRTCCYVEMTKITALEAVIEDKEFVEGHLFALTAMPKNILGDKEEALKNDILNKIGKHPNEKITKLHKSLFVWN